MTPLRWALLAALLAPAPAPLDEAALVGTWVGRPEHQGVRGELRLRFSKGADGAIAVAVSMPPIDVWELPVGTAELDEGTVRIGGFTLVWDGEARTLRGTLPESLVPVHEIEVTLSRVDSPDRHAPQGPVAAPEAQPVWSVATGGPVWAAPLYADGTVYAGSDDGAVRAIDAADGSLRWQLRTGGAIRARPTAEGDALYVPSDDGYLYKLSRRLGLEIWRFPLSEAPVARDPERYDHYASSAVIHEGSLYAGSGDGRLYCIDPDSGAGRWHFDTGGALRGTPALADGLAFFGSFDGSVYALDVRAGEQRWKRDTGAPVVSSPALHGGLVIVGSRSYDLLALDAATGRTEWSYYYWFSWVESSAALRDGVAYVGSSDAQRLNAIAASSGRLLWFFDTGGSAWGRPAVSDDAVFIGAVGVADYIVDHEGGFFAVDRESGRPRWQFRSEDPGQPRWGFASSPALGEGLVFVGGLDGWIYALPQDGVGAARSAPVEADQD